MMSAVDFFVNALYQVEEVPGYFWFAESFYQNGCWILSSVFSVSTEIIIIVFLLVCWYGELN